jgi:hypothetical protein
LASSLLPRLAIGKVRAELTMHSKVQKDSNMVFKIAYERDEHLSNLAAKNRLVRIGFFFRAGWRLKHRSLLHFI